MNKVCIPNFRDIIENLEIIHGNPRQHSSKFINLLVTQQGNSFCPMQRKWASGASRRNQLAASRGTRTAPFGSTASAVPTSDARFVAFTESADDATIDPADEEQCCELAISSNPSGW